MNIGKQSYAYNKLRYTYTCCREVAKYEEEVAHRTLKIQMLKTAVMPPTVDDEDDEY
jgi:hypothetical protein